MIKNIIFDFGQVLVHFEPEYMTRCYTSNKGDVELLKTVVFDRLYWDKLDSNGITDGELLEAVKARLPMDLHKTAEKIYNNWYYNLPEMEGMRDLLGKIRQKGYRTYVLSDVSIGFSDRYEEIDILKGFDGYCFSAAEGICKPDPAAIENLMQKYNLKAAECFFIDDREVNINGAAVAGVDGFVFGGDANALKSFLKEKGIL